jgi:lipoprotein-anchoring transpeptidase ErfK/SrfK
MSLLTVGVLAATALVTAPAAADEPAAPADQAPAWQIAAPSKAAGATVARIVSSTVARPSLDAPAGKGRPVRVATAWSRQPQTLLVVDAATRDGVDYVKVLLAQRPNGSSGWIPRDRVALSTTPYWVEVRRRSRTVTVYRGGRRLLKARAVVGAPSTPTPLGLAAVYERNRQPDSKAFLGPWALSLTSLSNVLQSYGGGPGRVAIHGRDGASFHDPLGTARSHGCIRINNKPVSWMARHLVPGTPVDVVEG